MNNEAYELSSALKCRELLAKYPDYKVFWQSGFSYRGATEVEMNRNATYVRTYPRHEEVSFEREMEYKYSWAAVIDIRVLHDKEELHFKGLSENDMF